MKITIALVLVSLFAASSYQQSFIASQMGVFEDQVPMTWDDVKWGNEFFQSAWNGFLRGYYRSTKTNMISDQCFGEWILSNATQLADYADKASQMNLSYEEASEAAVDIVNIIYKNFDYCQFNKFFQDNMNYFSNLDLSSDYLTETLIPTLQANLFQIGAKGMDLFNVLNSLSGEDISDEELFNVVDRVADDYGSILSYVLGFNKSLAK